MEKEATNKEILEAIIAFSGETDKRFEGMDKRFGGMDKRFEGMDKHFDKIEATMVTKDYLDDKLADFRGDLVVLTRKEDMKVKKLVEILKKHKLISDDEVKEILAMEPFPQLSI